MPASGCTDYVKIGLKEAVNRFRESEREKDAIFTNSRVRSHDIARALERKVNGAEMERPADLMYIHEMIVNLEKF